MHSKTKSYALSLGITLLAGAHLSAADLSWNAPDGGIFGDPANWDDGESGAPGAADVTIFDLAAAYQVTLTDLVATDRTLIRRGLVTFQPQAPGLSYELLGPSPAAPGIVVGALTGDAAELTIDFGSIVGVYAMIGDAPGALGALTLAGPIGQLHLNGDLAVGAMGTGFLDVTGGSAFGHRSSIGRHAGSFGAATIGGNSFSTWTLDEQLVIGDDGTGVLDIIDFGLVTSGDGIIAQGENSFGEVVVGGLLAHWTIHGSLDVGMNSFGALRVEHSGAVVTDSFATIGTFPAAFGVPSDGGVGLVEVFDTNTILSVGDDLFVGLFNEGRLVVGRRAIVLVEGDLIINRRDEAAPDPVVIEVGSAADYAGTPAIAVTGFVASDTGSAAVRLDLTGGFTPREGDAFDLITASGGLDDVEVITPAPPDLLVWVITSADGVLRATVAACPGDDCNGNGIGDACDLEFGLSLDCNGNGVPDECDITDGTSLDCNLNRVPDECDIAAGVVDDCNENGTPDICEVQSIVLASSGPLSPIGAATPQMFTLMSPPVASTDVSLVFTAIADLFSAAEFIDIFLNDAMMATIFVDDGADCDMIQETVIVPKDVFNDLQLAGFVAIDMVPSTFVSSSFCGADNMIEVTVEYAQLGDNDENGNGIPDDCECDLADLDGDNMIGFGDLLVVLSSWGACPGCVADLNGDDVVDLGDLLVVLSSWGPCR